MRGEEVANKLILLYTIDRLNKDEKVLPDRWKLHKTMFFMTKFMQKDLVMGITYSFYKDRNGPVSKELYYDWNKLIIAGLLERNYNPRIKDDGIEFLEACAELFKQNDSIMEYVNLIIEEVYGKSGKELRDLSHQFLIKYGKNEVPIDDIPIYFHILDPLPEDEAIKSFEISEKWIESIELALDLRLRRSIKKNAQTLDFEKMHTLEELITNASKI